MELDNHRPYIWRVFDVAFRLPSVFILEAVHDSTRGKWQGNPALADVAVTWRLTPRTLALAIRYFGYLTAFLLLALPLRKLTQLYKFILVGMLLLASRHLSTYFLSLHTDNVPNTVLTAIIYMSMQAVFSLTCAWLVGTRHVWLFAAYSLPLVGSVAGLPATLQESAHAAAQIISLTEVTIFTLSQVFVLYRLALISYKTLQECHQRYGLISVSLILYNCFFVPVLYLIFWLSMFGERLYVYYSTKDRLLFQEKWLLFFFAAMADCCDSMWSLIGLCYTVSYFAFVTLYLCRLYLNGFGSADAQSSHHQGWAEGITVMLLAVEMGFLQQKKIERVLQLSVIVFIVLASMIQSIFEILDPVLMSLAASNNRSAWKHVKALSLCAVLMILPLYLSSSLFQVFEVEFWLIIIVSSCLLTAIQTLGSLMIYLLFMADHRRSTSWESLDDIVYSIHAMCHILQFGIALSVLFNGGMKSFTADHNLLGVGIILLHFYCNVWRRAGVGWRSFLNRREAAKRVNSLPSASLRDLLVLHDVCAICLEEMSVAKITPCHHFFHNVCLRRWLYVQDKCPMCHKSIFPEANGPSSGHQERGQSADVADDH